MKRKINDDKNCTVIIKILLFLVIFSTILGLSPEVYSQCTVTIIQPPPFTAGAIDSTGESICFGKNPKQIGSDTVAGGGRGYITYEWRANGVSIPTSNAATYTPPAGLSNTTTYTRWAKDSLCNTTFIKSAGSWTVTINRPPTIQLLSAITPLCINDIYNPSPPIINNNGSPIIFQGFQMETSVGSGSYTNLSIPYTAKYSDNAKRIRYYAYNTCGTSYSNSVILSVNLYDTILIADTICAGNHYAVYGFDTSIAYTTSGYTIHDTNFNVNRFGCDSTTMLQLYVQPVDSILIMDTICAGNHYTANGFDILTIYTIAGYTINDTTQTVNKNGCDSTTMLQLYVQPVDSILIIDTICSGNHYVANGFNIPTVYRTNLYSINAVNQSYNQNGCDSITLLTLTVLPVDSIYIYDTICAGNHYNAYGFDTLSIYTTTNYMIYDTNRNFNKNACDSITVLQLLIQAVDSIVIMDTICSGSHYASNGFDILSIYTVTAYTIYDTNHNININDCDSLTMLQLYVQAVDSILIRDTICSGGHYANNGFDTLSIYTVTAYTIYDTNQTVNQNGCDSTTMLQLYIQAVDSILIMDTICSGGHYANNGFDTLSIYTVTAYTIYDTNQTVNQNGCDSTTMLQLYVQAVDSILIIDTICSGGHYANNGFDTLSIYTVTAYTIYDTNQTVNQNGCDSTTMLQLYVQSVDSILIIDTICSGTHYTAHNFDTLSIYTVTAYTIYDTNQTINQNGCDSTTMLQLYVQAVDSILIIDTICSGGHYANNGFDTLSIYTVTAYTIYDTNQTVNQNGCDSTTMLQLYVQSVDSILIIDTICSGTHYTAHNFDTLSIYTVTAYTIYDTNQTVNQNGCDSTTMLQLYVQAVDSILIIDTICSGGHYANNGFDTLSIYTVTAYTIYDTNQTVNQNGCDSTTMLQLYVQAVDSILIIDTICSGGHYANNGFDTLSIYTVTAYTIYDTNQTVNQNGCDSTTMLQLYIQAVDSILIIDTICSGGHYANNGFDTLSIYTVTAYTIYDTNQTVNQNGCDSTTMLQLYVQSVDSILIIDTICSGTHYTAHNFDTLSIYTVTAYTIYDTNQTVNQNGCDSTTMLQLYVQAVDSILIIDTICSGGHYANNGFDTLSIYTVTAYTIYDTNQTVNQNGCDSTTMLQLYVQSVDSILIIDTICSGTHYTAHNFDTLSIYTVTTYTIYDTNQTVNQNGCDSTTMLQLYVQAVDSILIIDTICSGGHYANNGFDTLSIYTVTAYTIYDTNQTVNQNGCDSTTMLQLYIQAVDSILIMDTICSGGHYANNGFDTLSIYTVTAFTIYDTNQTVNQNGCDSTTMLQLYVQAVDSILIMDTICSGGHYANNGFDTLSIYTVTAYTIYDTNQTVNQNGCDSTTILQLYVQSVDSILIIDTICSGGHYANNGFDTLSIYTVTAYTIYDTNQTVNQNGCDSTTMLQLYVQSVDSILIIDTICSGTHYTAHNFDTLSIYTVTAYTIYDTNQTVNQNGCDSTTMLQLYVQAVDSILIIDTICSGGHYANNGFDTLSIYTVTAYTIYDTNQTVNQNGCDSTTMLQLYVQAVDSILIIDTICSGGHYANNGFDTLSIYTVTAYTIYDTNQTVNQNGCDSTTMLQLYVQAVDSILIIDTICSGGHYANNGFDTLSIYTVTAYTIYDTNQTVNQNGCDSTTMLQLYVQSVDSILIIDTICSGGHYANNGFDTLSIYTVTAYTIYDTNQTINQNGCDSTTMLQLYVQAVDSILIIDTICSGGHYANNGFDTLSIYTVTAYTIYDTNQTVNQNGCDSTTMLQLYVQSVDSILIIDTICSGGHYANNGFDTLSIYTVTAYTIYDTNQTINQNGCDSTTMLQLYVQSVDSILIIDTICSGGHYANNGFDTLSIYTVTAYTIYDTNQTVNQNGCDSTTMLQLYVQSIDSILIIDTICSGGHYANNGFDTLSIYTVTAYTIYDTNQTVNQNGCDSTTMLQLYVQSVDSILIIDTICSGGHYANNGFDTLSIYTVTAYTIYDTNQTINQNGCDSTTMLQLYVQSVDSILIIDTICSGGHYANNGFDTLSIYTVTAYTIYDTNQTVNQNGCDSTTMLQLYVQSIDSILIIDTICSGGHYANNGFDTLSIYTVTAYTIYDTNQTVNQNDCDSTTMLQLYVQSVDSILIIDTICSGGYYANNGFDTLSIYTVTAYTIYDTNQTVNQNGCDSTTMLQLYVQSVDSILIMDTICSGGHYANNGFDTLSIYTITAYTIYDTNQTVNQNGCDSTTMLQLYVQSVDSILIIDTICSGGHYANNGFDTLSIYTVTAYTIYDTNQTVNQNGCDSTTMLQLYVQSVDSILIIDTICSGGYYANNGFDTLSIYTVTAYTIYDTNQTVNQNGCDSTTMLQLYVQSVDSILIMDTICSGGHYANNGFDTLSIYTVMAYTIYDTNQTVNQNGCDSTTMLQLYVQPVDSVLITDMVCAGIRYPLNGFDTMTFHTLNSYIIYDTNQNINSNGCDSITMLALTVLPVDSVIITDTICAGFSYSLPGFHITTIYTTTGYNIYDTLQSVNQNGCDSTTMLQLYVLPIDSILIFDTICAGSHYISNGFDTLTIFTTTEYTIYDTNRSLNKNACDSITTLVLTVWPVDSIFIIDTICAGHNYNWNGFYVNTHYTTTGYTVFDTNLNTNQNTCDSITILQLFILAVDSILIKDSICAGGHYTSMGFDTLTMYTTTAYTIYDTNQSVNQNGCDSTTILQLYVLPVDSILITDIICPGISYTINGFDTATHHTTGGYIIYDTNQNINKKGCDSISMLALTVLPVDSILVTDTICAGNTYASNGFYTTSVSTTTAYIIYDTNQSVNQNGCDSISMLALYVQAVDSIIIYDTICSGKHYTSNGFDTLSKLSTILYTIFDTNQNINHKGCDSITILQLTVWPVDSIFITDTICAGENYNDNGFVSFSMFTTTGYTVFDTNRSFNQYSSDSITLLHLTILPVDSVIIHDTICAGCRYSHKGFDTISLYSTIEYTIYDTNQTTNQNGCDSITMLGLLVLPVDSVLIVDSVCSGRNYTSNSFNITTIITTKEYIINDTNQSVNFNGCDSITSLHLTVLPVDSIFIADTICAGRNYVLNGFNIKTHYTTTGYTVFDTNRLYNHNGSDSITIIQLTVLAVDSILIKDTICCGSHYTFNGFDTLSKYTVSGYIIYDTNQNINQEGCDSISMLQLTVFPVDSVFIIDTICAGNHYTHHGFDTITIFTNNGYTIFDTNKTANKNGCDSVTILILSVLPHELVDIADNICSGEQYTSNGFNISTIYSTKSYTVIDTNFAISQYGCDSTTILSLTVLPVDSISISDIICSGEYYNLNGFKTPTTHSTYSYTLYDTLRTNTKDGCKCIKTLQLLVLPVDSVYIYDSICSGNVYDLNGFNIKAVNSTRSHVINDTNRNRNLNSCDSITILQLTVLATDSIFIIDTVCAGEHYKSNGFNVPTQSSIEGYFINKSNHFVNEKGCDSTTSLLLIVNPIPDVDLGHDTAVCPGVSYPIELNAGANFTSYLWNTGERTQKINVMQEGNYTVKTQNIHKCENSDTVKVVDLTDFYVQIESLSDFCDYHKTTLIANTDASSLIWNTGDTSDNIEIHIHGTYSVKAYEMGCMVADFFIVDSCLLRLFIPNAITPSDKNDVNDCFEIVYPPYFPATDFEIIIFDRWGNKAFKSNDLYFKWCGTTSNDNTSHNNIFTYIINFYAYGVKHTFKGTITVL